MFGARPAVAFSMVVAILAVVPAVGSGEENTGILYGADHAFMVTAPSGWVLDNESGAGRGLYAVFYPAGSSWKDSVVVMYINTASKQGDPTLDDLIAGDLERQRRESPELRVRPGEAIELSDGAQATVNHLSGDRWGNHESIAYIEAPTVWVMVVLSSRDEAAYEAALPAFYSLTKTYTFLTSQVDIKE